MASSFLEQKAKAQAEKLEKQYGSTAYGGTTWLKEQEKKRKKKKQYDDIAPVRTTTKEEDDDKKLDFFQKGAFEDGYDFGDVTKSILGTLGDATVGAVKGVTKMAEGVVDAGAYGVAGIADRMGNDNFADELRVKARENTIDKAFEKTDSYLDQYSLLGRTSDAVAEGIGQVGAIILSGGIAGAAGLGAVGTTLATTGMMGVSSIGSGMSEAYESGATDEEAATYGLIKGVVDAGSEMIFGGLGKTVKALGLSRGLSSLDDVFAQKLASKIADQTAKNFVEFGVKASAEGVEEVLAGLGSAAAKKLTYMDDEELSKLIADENLLEQFVVGTVSSGIAQSGIVPGMKKGSLREANKTGRDFVSGLSENEQKVIDRELQNRIVEKEKNGEKLTDKQKNDMYDAVVSDMEKGRISIDTIEEVLGGDTYKSYKDTIDKEDALAKEYEELGKLKDPTLAERTRYNELHEQMKTKDDSQRTRLKSQLGDEVFNMVKGDRLVESYNERARKSQAYEADLSKYDDKQKAIIQKAADSGILNNTRRTHEFVDMVARISADKGVPFDFTNNQKLKESGFAVEGKTVNGFVHNGNITLNMQSAKALDTVVGHEITHVLEGTELYDALKQTVFEYAKSKNVYDSRLADLTETYKNVKDADIEAELTADLVGDFLFTDTDFVNSLTANKNVFQKIYDEIKYLCKIATAGSEEARNLEKVKRAFEKAYREGSKAKDGTQYSVTDSSGKQLTEAQQEYFKDSVVRDANGNLLKLYHTTKNDFTVFDKSRKGEATGDSNTYLGFFFADDPEYMQNFPELEGGKTEEYYLNMKNPIDMTNISREAFLDIVEVMGGDVAEASIVYDEELFAEQQRAKRRGDNDTRLLLSDLLDTLTGEYYYEDFYNELKPHYDELMSRGYDGVVNYLDELFGVKEYIVLDSNQAKLASNESPTSSDDTRYSLSSIANTFFGDENMSANEFTKVDYRETQGYKDYVDQCVNNYKQTRKDFDEGVARKEIEDAIDGIVKVAIAAKKAGYDIYDDATKRSTKDSKNRLLFSSLEPNSDYFTSNDISTICDKRKNFAEIYDDIVRAEEAKGVPAGKRFFDNVDNYFYLHKLMADKGLTQPCRQCYVESMRKNLAPMASAFLRLVKETNPDNLANDQLYQQKGKNKGQLKSNNASTREWVLSTLEEYGMSVNDLTVETLTTEDGLAALKIRAPMIYEAFNSFYGQSKPKMPKAATPFRFGELTALLTDEKGRIKKSVVDKINSTGGFRLQSYSDFQIQNFTDTLQVLFEAGTLGLNGHAYTKVPAFLEATEGTNLKRNISIFMYKDGDEWKLDRNDSFPYSLEEIYDIVKADKTGNTSIIAVSQNEDMSAWIMANDLVGYGIPFHKSGLKMGTVRDTIVREDGREIKGYKGTKDHTKQQTEVWAKAGEDHKALTKVKKGINVYSFWDFDNKANLSKNELIEKNVKAYIDACEDAGYLPKFREYVMNNGKVLNNVLEYAKKLGFAPQDATIADISFEYKGYTIPYGYYKFLGDFGMFTPDGKASPQEVLSLKNYDFGKAVEFFADAETLHRNEILQQFSNGEERQRYRDSDLTAGELQDIVKQKRNEIAEEVSGSYSLSNNGDVAPIGNFYGKDMMLEETAPVAEQTAPVAELTTTADAPPISEEIDEDVAPVDVSNSAVLKRMNAKLSNSNAELSKNKQLRAESAKAFDEKIAKAQAELDAKKNKDTKTANAIKRRIERLNRMKADRDAEYAKRIGDIQSRITRQEADIQKYHPGMDRAEKSIARIDRMLEYDKSELDNEFKQKREGLQDKNSYISKKASELYDEIRNIKKGVRASALLGEMLDAGHEWSSIRAALVNIKHTPAETVNVNSAAESLARELLNEDYENSVLDLDEDYAKRVKQLEDDADKKRKASTVAHQRKSKQEEYKSQMESLAGDTSTWVDKKLGISYRINTLRRNLRDVVRKADGSRDIEKADAIYDELQGKYNHNEAMLNRESNRIKGEYAKLKINSAEDVYIQMLGEFRHNPDTTLTEDKVKEFYEAHKDSIDTKKVDKVIDDARKTYDELLVRVNEVLREQGMKEIPYRKGYFPHFTEEKQGFLAKLFNWKTQNTDIPTSIAGLTENFNPNRSWQSFNKQRKGDTTDYSFQKGLDTYVQGALDWIYHIDDIQKRRAFENHIRYVHSEQGVKDKIDAIRNNEEYDADEMQEQIDLVYAEANNPLNNFVTDLRAGTNTLANKKSSLDRGVEEMTNRKFYSTMTNISNRVSANMVGGSVSSALTNFIPITQSWGEVSPMSSLRAMGDTIRSTFRDDGVVDKSDFLTNRLRKSENLYKTTWDKVSDKVGLMMEGIDNFTSQTVWRSKYLENISNGMSEAEAIQNADQFAENVMAGRSRGNQPTIFDSKNPLIKTLTAFQLEVSNQYGYMFKDMPQDMRDESVGKLVKGYVTMFMGAYAYNALYSSLTGRDAAFDPISIIEDLLRDMGLVGDDEEEEPTDIAMNLVENILDETPFVGGLMGGGRIPISSALPYDGNVLDMAEGASKLIFDGDMSDLTSEWMKPVYYLALPVGGGQIKKTVQGLNMFSDDHPIAGSYTKSGGLRFTVEDTPASRIKAGIFGQYASKNAREYFDSGRTPLSEKQTQELIDVDLPIKEYWEYRDGLKEQEELEDKFEYINNLDLPVSKKNILINNVVDRKTPVDLSNYDDFSSYDEFDFYSKNTEKYNFLKENGVSYKQYTSSEDAKEQYDSDYSWYKNNPEKVAMANAVADNVLEYRGYTRALNAIKADKDSDGKSITGSRKEKVLDYINNLDADYYTRIILWKSEYQSDDTYNYEIIDYLNSRDDISYEDTIAILRELGFTVKDDGSIYWD